MSPSKRLVVGQGQISGYISIFLAVLALLGILCFHYPEKLTTPEFREIYTKDSMEALMLGGVIASFFFAALSVILSKKLKYGWPGFALAALAVVLGALSVEGRDVAKSSWHFGLDWMILDLLLMVAIFVPLELFFPKNNEQTKFHEEWRTDLTYFVISHLFIQFFGIVTQKPAVLFFGWMGLDKLHTWVQGLPFIVALFLAFFHYRFISILGASLFPYACFVVALSLYSSFNAKHGLAGWKQNALHRYIFYQSNDFYSFIHFRIFINGV